MLWVQGVNDRLRDEIKISFILSHLSPSHTYTHSLSFSPFFSFSLFGRQSSRGGRHRTSGGQVWRRGGATNPFSLPLSLSYLFTLSISHARSFLSAMAKLGGSWSTNWGRRKASVRPDAAWKEHQLLLLLPCGRGRGSGFSYGFKPDQPVKIHPDPFQI